MTNVRNDIGGGQRRGWQLAAGSWQLRDVYQAANALAAALLIGEILRPDFVGRVASPPLVAGIWLAVTLLASRISLQAEADWRQTRWLVAMTVIVVGSLAWIVLADVPDHRLLLATAAAALGGALTWNSFNSR